MVLRRPMLFHKYFLLLFLAYSIGFLVNPVRVTGALLRAQTNLVGLFIETIAAIVNVQDEKENICTQHLAQDEHKQNHSVEQTVNKSRNVMRHFPASYLVFFLFRQFTFLTSTDFIDFDSNIAYIVSSIQNAKTIIKYTRAETFVRLENTEKMVIENTEELCEVKKSKIEHNQPQTRR